MVQVSYPFSATLQIYVCVKGHWTQCYIGYLVVTIIIFAFYTDYDKTFLLFYKLYSCLYSIQNRTAETIGRIIKIIYMSV